MNALTILGLMSVWLVILFTWVAYSSEENGSGQTRREAIIEVWIGILVGFSVTWLLNWLVLPLVGAKFTAMENLYLGAIYTLVSVMRGFFVRRWANTHIQLFSTRLAARFS